jgi:replicative DNA helicase
MGGLFGIDEDGPARQPERTAEPVRQDQRRQRESRPRGEQPQEPPERTAEENAAIKASIPPQNLTAEKSVLGGILIQNDSFDEIGDFLKSEHFYLDTHQSIYTAIVEMYHASIKIDAVTLAERLEKNGRLEDIGGVPYILELLETVPHAAHAKYYADIVVEQFRRRESINVGVELQHKCRDMLEPIEDTIGNADQKLVDIVNIGTANREVSIGQCLMDAMDTINDRLNQQGLAGVSTGYSDLDEVTGGMCKSNLVILGARPSMGKTALMLNMARATAQNGIFTAIYSLEQSMLALAERFIVADSQLDGHNVRSGKLGEADRFAILESASKLNNLPIVIADNASMSVTEIMASARRLKRRNNLGMVFIDYLQIIRSDEPKAPREQQVSTIAKRLKQMSKALDIPVVALSQLNREVEKREDKRPRLSDLRETGAIEQDADLIMFLHRPDAYNPEEKPGEAEVVVAKNRDGRVGVVSLAYRKHCFRFDTLSRQDFPGGPGMF